MDVALYLAALLIACAIVFGGRILVVLVTRIRGDNPWPWWPKRWGWLLLGIAALTELLVRTTERAR